MVWEPSEGPNWNNLTAEIRFLDPQRDAIGQVLNPIPAVLDHHHRHRAAVGNGAPREEGDASTQLNQNQPYWLFLFMTTITIGFAGLKS